MRIYVHSVRNFIQKQNKNKRSNEQNKQTLCEWHIRALIYDSQIMIDALFLVSEKKKKFRSRDRKGDRESETQFTQTIYRIMHEMHANKWF